MAVKIKGKRLVSIVIKNENIRIAELSRGSKQIRVYKTVLIDTPVGAVNDGVIEDSEALAGVILTALYQNNIRCKDVIFSLVSGRIAMKEVVLPEIKENRIADIVATNAAEYFPVDIEHYIVKHTILERFTENEEKKLKLQVTAAPSSLVKGYYALAETLGLRVLTIDHAGNSAYQLLRQQISKEFCVVINIENESTVISIFENNTLKMQRTIPFGKSVLVNAVLEEYGLINEKDALQKLQEENLLHISFDGDELTESLSYLVSNINRITDYYVSRHESRHFEKAYIIGNATTIRGIVTLLSNELTLNLTAIDTLQNVILEKRTLTMVKQITDFVPNIGAVIAPIDLQEEETAAAAKKSGTSPVFLLIASLLAAAVMIAMPLMDILSLEEDIDKVKFHIEQISDANEIAAAFYVAQDMFSDAFAFAALTVDNDDYLHLFIDKLEEKIPSDVSFTNINITSGAVTISGKASSKSSVAKLIQQLYTIESVSDVYVSNETESKDSTDVITVSFALTCTFGAITEPTEDTTEE